MDIDDLERHRLCRRDMMFGAAALATLTPTTAVGQTAAQVAGRSRVILLGTAGGPSPKPNRAAPAQAVIVNGATYVVDCGNGVARQMVMAGIGLASIRSVFLTHHHSDHNADYGNLLLLAWANSLVSPVDCYGPPPISRMTRQFLALNAFDIKTRIADEGRPSLRALIRPHDLNAGGLILQDANVTVTAALVAHPPVKPGESAKEVLTRAVKATATSVPNPTVGEP